MSLKGAQLIMCSLVAIDFGNPRSILAPCFLSLAFFRSPSSCPLLLRFRSSEGQKA